VAVTSATSCSRSARSADSSRTRMMIVTAVMRRNSSYLRMLLRYQSLWRRMIHRLKMRRKRIS